MTAEEEPTDKVEEVPPVVTDEAKNTETAKKPARQAEHVSQVVGDGDQDEVMFRAIVYKNRTKHKSLSVHHLQRRLAEKGFNEAESDFDGYFGDLTESSVKLWQAANKYEVTGRLDFEQLTALFDGDQDVKVVY